MNYKYKYHALRRDCFNLSLLAHRDFDNMLVTMHQSGTHWLNVYADIGIDRKIRRRKTGIYTKRHFFGNPSAYQCDYEIARIASTRSLVQNYLTKYYVFLNILFLSEIYVLPWFQILKNGKTALNIKIFQLSLEEMKKANDSIVISGGVCVFTMLGAEC